jgi:hypothetical protein
MRRLFYAAVVALGFASGAYAQSSQALLVPEVSNAPDAQARLEVLMQPILPLVAGSAGSTTTINQVGLNNYATAGVEGAANLTVIEQSGSHNRAVQAIQGNNSALLLVQGGTNNNVLQASVGDRNFQMVGVSGQNNNVGYVQMGNDLAGALDVTDAQNATVLAFQTPQSGRYLMPTGLHGLKNATVVIVPGRMYVLPR